MTGNRVWLGALAACAVGFGTVATAQPVPDSRPAASERGDIAVPAAPDAPVPGAAGTAKAPAPETVVPDERPEETLTVDGAYGIADTCVGADAPAVGVIRIGEGAVHDVDQSCLLNERVARDDGIVRFVAVCNGGAAPADGFYYAVDDGRLVLDYGAGAAIWRRCIR